MAELAAGAVSSLLGVIRNEALLLGGVRDDVQFIKEEMESMKSFLAHLARTSPPGGEHDEQVRTWMNQVRLLAQDCNNCLDLYLYRGNPDIHRARGGVRRYLWWVPWFLHKLAAQHRAATQLRQLKERARDVGKRRLRYGVEVPAKSSLPGTGRQGGPSSSSSPSVAAGLTGAGVPAPPMSAGWYGYGEEDGDDEALAAMASDHSGRRTFFQPRTLDDYVKEKLLEWVQGIEAGAGETLSIAIVAPDADQDVLALAQETLVVPPSYHLGITVDIPAVHMCFEPLGPKAVLYYILRELKHAKSRSHNQGQGPTEQDEKMEQQQDYWQVVYAIYVEKKTMLREIKESNIKGMKISDKLDKIICDFRDRQLKEGDQQQLLLLDSQPIMTGLDQLDLDLLLRLLLLQSAAAMSQQDQQVKNKGLHILLPASDETIIAKTAKKLKEYMEVHEMDKKDDAQMAVQDKEATAKQGGGEDKDGNKDWKEKEENEDKELSKRPIRLQEAQYAQILRQVFPLTSTSRSKPPTNPVAQQQDRSLAIQPTKTTGKTSLDEEKIKPMIHEAKQEILMELQDGKLVKNHATGAPSVLGKNPQAVLEEFTRKIKKIKKELQKQLKIKGLVDKIKHHLKDGECPLIILKVDEMMDGSQWEEIRKALSLLDCSADALIFTTAKSTQQVKGYCYPPQEPIHYSPVGLYYDTLLQLTRQQKHGDNYKIFRSILEECDPNEFCMKMFTHTLYSNPKRSNEELIKLHETLQGSPKSVDIICKKMFKFCYNDLPKEYKSCFLSLAIFSPGHKIRRSTMIARWVAEGLLFNEDWPNSVRHANQCFDTLIDRWLIYPADIGATGTVKSCVIGDLVHGFITKIARKQHIVETRLSHHLARHFSIFNNLQLRNSDGIDKFFERISESSRISLLKVLDLEGCKCFHGKNQLYLKLICRKMLLLKYLNLKGTDVTQLPSEINNLHELEVLDMRQTKVLESTIKDVMLLKLKRLLVGHIYPIPRRYYNGMTIGGDELSSVIIPDKIEKMVNMEVLSNVRARKAQDLKDIGKLWQLRKLGVVIDDKDSHIRNLLRAIRDLNECLCSLSITLSTSTTRREPIPCVDEYSYPRLRHPPKLVESLSISGTTLKGSLLPLFAKDDNNILAKVTLCSTFLNQGDLKVLAKLPKLVCLRLRQKAYTGSILTFSVNEFPILRYFLVEGPNMTDISFEDGAAPMLQKMVLSFTDIQFIGGVNSLSKLEELELNSNNFGRLLSSFDDAKQISKWTLRGTLLDAVDLQHLAKKPNVCCLMLLDKSCDLSQITFNKNDFPKLNLLIVDCTVSTTITFTSGSAPKLEKLVWSSLTSLSGIENLPKLKELEFNGDIVPNVVKEAIRKHKRQPNLKHNEPAIQNQAKGDRQEDDDDYDDARFPFCWKKKV